jgi:hypothetical protein
LPCIIPPGSTKGVCGNTNIPDGGGSGGAGGSGGTSAGGAGGTGGTPCALYGQSCTVTSDCCGGVPCTNGKCVYPVQ